MSYSADVLAGALEELMPGYVETFIKWHPLLEKLWNGGKIERGKAKGYKQTFTVLTGGPGQVTGINTGAEQIQGGRSQNAYKGEAHAGRMIYAFDVPRVDLDEVNNEQDMARLLEDYPEAALGDFWERLASQLGVGNGTDVGNFPTLCGDTTYTDRNGTPQGILEFAAPTSQTNTVHGLDKASVSGWTNQYGVINSFTADGRKTLRKVFHTVSRQHKALGIVDLMLGDEDSFLNLLDDMDDYVHISAVKDGDHGEPGDSREGIKVWRSEFWLDDAIDVTAPTVTTADAQEGIIYLFKTKTWRMFTMSGDKNRSTPDMQVSPPMRPYDLDAYRFEIVLHAGLYCKDLRCNGVVTGGARE